MKKEEELANSREKEESSEDESIKGDLKAEGEKGELSLEELKKRLEEKEKEAETYYDKLLRTQAELENFKKRASKEKADLLEFGNAGLVKELLPIVDNLERASEHAKKSGDSRAFGEGMEMILKDFLGQLKKFGVQSFSSIGERFNPLKHEAVAQIEDNEHEPFTIVSEFQKGYFLKDRLLRPAIVTVVKPLTKEKEEAN